MKEAIITKIKNKDFKIAIVGMGYVGLPLALRFNSVGFEVIGIDIDDSKVAKLNNCESYIKHISKKDVEGAIKTNKFFASTDFSLVRKCDAIIICVPTPLDDKLEPDLSYVRHTRDKILQHVKKGQLVSLESTTYPGTTEEEFEAVLKDKGFNIGQDFFIVYSPEREDPANQKFSTDTIPKVCGGITKECRDIGAAMYSAAIDKIVLVESAKVAEMTKLLENIHRAVNIGLVNEMKIIASKMDIDIFDVIDAAATKPFGFTPYYPGPGLGGHCIPIDPFYLSWKSKQIGIDAEFIELSGKVNRKMPLYVVNNIIDIMKKMNMSMEKSKILLLGMAYKKNVDDMRESPSLEILKQLERQGLSVDYSDPFINKFENLRKYQHQKESISVTVNNLKKYDITVLLTDHDQFNYDLIFKHSNIIIDTRGKFRKDNKRIFSS